MPASLKKRFMARYVILAEIVGYIFVGILLSLWSVFFFITIDEHCYGPGVAKPATLELKTESRAVLEATLVHDGEWVKKGQAIFRLNLDPKAIAARQSQEALSTLGNQIVTLADDPKYRASLEGTVAGLVHAVGGISTGRKVKDITAPESGILHFLAVTSKTLDQSVVEGVLGQVVSDKRLQVEADLGTLNRDRVKVGQSTKITLVLGGNGAARPGLVAGAISALKRVMPGKHTRDKTETVGRVIKLPAADKVLIEAPVDDPVIAKILSDQVLHPDRSPEPMKAETRVVVGNIRLVKFLFQQTTPPPDISKKNKKEEPILKRLWHKIFPPGSKQSPDRNRIRT